MHLLQFMHPFIHSRCNPDITRTPGMCKQTSLVVCVDFSTYFIFRPMLLTNDLILSWKSFFVDFIASL